MPRKDGSESVKERKARVKRENTPERQTVEFNTVILVLFALVGAAAVVILLPFFSFSGVEVWSDSWWLYASAYWGILILALVWIVLSAIKSKGRANT